MATLKEKITKWKQTRSPWQKALDMLFWVLLVLLIIPGPRKVIATQVNRLVLNLKGPGILKEDKQVELTDIDYQWVLGTADSEPVFLSDLRDQVIFLNFWATWCPPCVAEMPEIQKAYQKHKNQVAFLLVTNEKPEVVEGFMEKHGYEMPILYPGTEIPEVFQAGALPTTFVISRDGKIVAKKTGAANWDSRATDKMFEELVR